MGLWILKRRFIWSAVPPVFLINLVPRALFLPLLHLKGKGGLDTSSQIKKEDNYDTSSCSSGLKENIVER